MAKTTTSKIENSYINLGELTPREYLNEVQRLLQEAQKAYVRTVWNEAELKDPRIVKDVVELQHQIDNAFGRVSTCRHSLRALERTYYGNPL